MQNNLKLNIDGLKKKVFMQCKQGKRRYQIAKECGIDNNRFSAILNGRQRITLNQIIKLCELFKCEIQDIVTIEVK